MKQLRTEDVAPREVGLCEIVAYEKRTEIVTAHRRHRRYLLARPARADIKRKLAIFGERTAVLEDQAGRQDRNARPDFSGKLPDGLEWLLFAKFDRRHAVGQWRNPHPRNRAV